MPHPRRPRLLLALVAAALAVTACGSAGTPSGGDAVGVARIASDDGVNGGTITIGVLAGAVVRSVTAGFASDVGDLRSIFETFLVSVNAQGGINGRTLDWVYEEFDVSGGSEALTAACDRLFADRDLFAVVASSSYGDVSPCVSTGNGAPLVTLDSLPRSAFASADGNLFTLPAASEVSIAATVQLLAANGSFEGKTIGVVYGDRPGMADTLEKGLVPALAANGKSLAATVKVTGASADPRMLAQFPTAIETLRGAKVDAVFVLHDPFFTTNFLTTAQKSGYKPQVYASDYLHLADAALLPFIDTYGAASAFDGMLGVTYTRTGDDTSAAPADPIDQGCVSRYSVARGPDVPTYGSQRWSALVQVCNQLDLVLRALKESGDNPTRRSFRDALTKLGGFHIGFGGRGSFSTGKQDAADEFRVVRFDATKRAFVPIGEAARAGR